MSIFGKRKFWDGLKRDLSALWSLSLGVFAALLLLPITSYADSERQDFDTDDDGLIEIYDVQDLNEMRYNLEGKGLYGKSVGCPQSGCMGFELVTDLDLDTNGNGHFDEGDMYWNEGMGWEPIGAKEEGGGFKGIFDGNGFVIQNLHSANRSEAALFMALDSAQLRNMALESVSIQAETFAAGLAVFARASTVEGCFVSGAIDSRIYLAGLVMELSNSQVTASYTHLQANTDAYFISGIASTSTASSVVASYSVITQKDYNSYSEINLVSLSDEESTLQSNHIVKATFDPGHGDLGAQEFHSKLAQLQCPIQADNTQCAEQILYEGWGQHKNSYGEVYWYFGNAQQLPSLYFQSEGHKDSDADGVLDVSDAFPGLWAAALDADEDGHPGINEWNPLCIESCKSDSQLTTDQFPVNNAVHLDADNDGLADSWTAGCDAQCIANSGLVLDEYLNDSDNDGIPNSADEDDTNDGLRDLDRDSNGLIDIYTLDQLSNILTMENGAGLNTDGDFVNSGCPVVYKNGEYVTRCFGFELMNDLNFDSNQDGQFDSLDDYWNDGEGWLAKPLGSRDLVFGAPQTTVFEGNGYLIKNLVSVSNDYQKNGGLFSNLWYAEVRNLGIVGSLTNIQAKAYMGALAGHALSSYVHEVFVTAELGSSEDRFIYDAAAGGIVGLASDDTLIENTFASGRYKSINRVAGIANGGFVKNSFSTASLTGEIIWPINTEAQFESSYWLENSAHYYPHIYNPSISSAGMLTAEALACLGNTQSQTCTQTQNAQDWDTGHWDFGSDEEFPGLIINGTVYRDADGDGVLDRFDHFPLLPEASLDNDQDGAPDRWNLSCAENCRNNSSLILDAFPADPAASQDEDHDGLPDAWNASCDAPCRVNAVLILDEYLNDTDNDGINNSNDWDDNNDNIRDADADSDGLIDIETVQELYAVRYALSSQGQRFKEGEPLDTSGCPGRIVDGIWQPGCVGYELINSIRIAGTPVSPDNFLEPQPWTSENGWQPIGEYQNNQPFMGIFEGNGFSITNLFADTQENDEGEFKPAGLFAYIRDAQIKNLHVHTSYLGVRGGGFSAILAGRVERSLLVGSSVSGSIHFKFPSSRLSSYSLRMGGLAAEVKRSVIKACKVKANIVGSFGGALAANIERVLVMDSYTQGSAEKAANFVAAGAHSTVLNSYSAMRAVESLQNNIITNGTPLAPNNIGPSSFNAAVSIDFINSYWVNDLVYSNLDPGLGVPLQALRCPTSANNQACFSQPLFVDWDLSINQQSEPVWQFGSNEQLPKLYFESSFSFDSDGDGFDDEFDAFPQDDRVATDEDSDGYPDYWTHLCGQSCRAQAEFRIDHFPSNPAAALDLDFDHMPDEWLLNCDLDCQSNSGLTLDPAINDRDNDGINDIEDSDDNNDGVKDIDADSDGLIEIDSYEKLLLMRENLLGSSIVGGFGRSDDTSGCPANDRLGEYMPACKGYELMIDIDFNSPDIPRGLSTLLPWKPVGIESAPFSAVFDGNGHIIKGLYVYGPHEDHQGFFGVTKNAEIKNIGFEGEGTAVIGERNVGGIIGTAINTKVSNCYFRGSVIAQEQNAAGIVGNAEDVDIHNCYVKGSISTLTWPRATLDTRVGPIASRRFNSGESEKYYRLYNSFYSVILNDSNLQLADLACPTASSSADCARNSFIYQGWPTYNPATGEGLWDFGTASDLPSLVPVNNRTNASSSSSMQSSASVSSEANSSEASSTEHSSAGSNSSSQQSDKQQGGSAQMSWLAMFMFLLMFANRSRVTRSRFRLTD